MRTLKVKDKIWIQRDGRIYAISANKKSTRSDQEETQELVAPFSCKVLKILAKPSTSIKKGDLVIVVEAMKMEYSYHSPKDGEIERVLVKEGEILTAGAKFVSWKEKK